MPLVLLTCLLLLASPAYAIRVQILHSNDLHSHFEGGEGKGGYARLKTTVDHLKAQAATQGIPTLFLDGGDFGEGSSFFFAEDGATALKLLDDLGVDVTVIGNHDLLQGGEELATLLKRAHVKADVLAANLNDKFLTESHGLVKSMVVKSIGGVRIGIAGLTTSELHYQYAIRDTGKVKNPLREIGRIEAMARDAKVDYFIALTHIGSKTDVKLVERSRSIDLVVGAHSHERLDQPILARNKNSRPIPIVQAGAHAMAVGQVILDIDPVAKKHQLISSHVHVIPMTTVANARIQAKVDQAKKAREAYFGRSWDEPIGRSQISLTGHVNGRTAMKRSCWGKHLAVMLRDRAGADVGIHASGFTGKTIDPGMITFGDLIDNFPHFRTFGDRGWTIGTVKLAPAVVKSVAAFVDRLDLGLDIAMPKTEIEGRGWLVAFPTEIAYGLEQTVPMLKGLLARHTRDTGISYWESMESHVRDYSPLVCLP
jgi:2',3'-cyclic-nucleotide 2'-phosphodiesterase (5'-nucleotidase family)